MASRADCQAVPSNLVILQQRPRSGVSWPLISEEPNQRIELVLGSTLAPSFYRQRLQHKTAITYRVLAVNPVGSALESRFPQTIPIEPRTNAAAQVENAGSIPVARSRLDFVATTNEIAGVTNVEPASELISHLTQVRITTIQQLHGRPLPVDYSPQFTATSSAEQI